MQLRDAEKLALPTENGLVAAFAKKMVEHGGHGFVVAFGGEKAAGREDNVALAAAVIAGRVRARRACSFHKRERERKLAVDEEL